MKLATKIRKLYNGEAIVSGWEHLTRLTHPVDSEAMLTRLDPAEVAEIQRVFALPPAVPRHHTVKYSNSPYWIRINVERAQDLWLDRMPPLRILDLGCGPGYFLYVARCLGHDGIGMDVDEEEPVCRRVIAMLGVRRVVHRIEPSEPLPDLGEKFDLVSAQRICFHRIGYVPGESWESGKEWGVPEWTFFLRDVRTRFLKPGGRLLLDFNPHADGTWYTPEVRAYFQQQGGKFRRSKVLLPQDASQTVHFKPRAA